MLSRTQIIFFKLFTILILFLSMFMQPKVAYACSCQTMDTPQNEFGKVDGVLIGKVTRINKQPVDTVGTSLLWLRQQFFPSNNLSYSFPGLDIDIEVRESWKGISKTAIVLQTGLGGADCGYPFTINNQYMIYAYEFEGRWETSICTRTNDIALASDDLNYLNTIRKIALSQSISPSLLGSIMCGICLSSLIAFNLLIAAFKPYWEKYFR